MYTAQLGGETAKQKFLTDYNSVICNEYTTPTVFCNSETEPPSTICEFRNLSILITILTVNTPGVIDDYDFDDVDKIHYKCPQPNYPTLSTSPSLSPSQYLKYQRKAEMVQANQHVVESTDF